MQLPEGLRKATQDMAATAGAGELRAAAQTLSKLYRQDSGPPPLRTEVERIAYTLIRMPATYAAVRVALSAISECLFGWEPTSLLDLGSGPGTGVWAAVGQFTSLRSSIGIEREAAFIQLASRLGKGLPFQPEWKTADLRAWTPDHKHELVLAAYSIGELPADARRRLISAAWEACSGTLVLVEAGTRRGFDVIAEAREQLISSGCSIVAPCPHEQACPMKLAGDWCHFSARVERTAEHRRLKQGELGHEDEKFSYIAATRLIPERANARIVRHPQIFSGYTRLQLCAQEGLRQQTVTRSQKERYRAVKRAGWGAAWNED
jgi:ribosomal protein RSM22 (predicted rRNA methylase)